MRLPPPAVFPAEPDSDDRAALWTALAPQDSPADHVLRAVMISSIDGTAVVDGASGPLGTPVDNLVYSCMRARADLVLVGARTALDEDYGPAETPERWAALRAQSQVRGQAPLVVLLARSARPEIVDHCLRRGAEGFALAVPCGAEGIDAAQRSGLRVFPVQGAPKQWIPRLAQQTNSREIACEGGPRLLASLLEADVVDELVLSISPTVRVGLNGSGIVAGSRPTTRGFSIAAAFTGDDGGLYTRWVRTQETP